MHPAGPRSRRLPPTVRVRLTALYGGLLLLSGTILLTVTYLWTRQSMGQPVTVTGGDRILPPGAQPPAGTGPPSTGVTDKLPPELEKAVSRAQDAMLAELLTISVIAVVVLALTAVLVGWWLSGHVLRPVHRITTTAQRLSWENLHERIALPGPRGEFKELADTFDALLARLERAFDSQRRFIANASHELRTPLTIQRATLQIGLGGATTSPEKLATVRQQLLDANRRAERLIDGLLLLAQSDRGLLHREPVALREMAEAVADQHAADAKAADITLHLDLHAVTVLGDPVLLTQLLTNLIQNAGRHNRPGGDIHLHTSARAGLVIRNTGPLVPAEAIPNLFEPFRRMGTERIDSAEGAGLGLSIVRSIVQAHAGTVTARPNPSGGGLEIHVTLPQLPTARQRPSPPSPSKPSTTPTSTPPASCSPSSPSAPSPPGPAGAPSWASRWR
ncbi:sensor histidine kinase [Streptomyces coffeae]|uniref:histidine kinase n=1 Tax=Streptomyces coffeae TaxID=621382 RepID=A0ABS1NCH5_9ACTN|nr:ATP-binding protein [Streptomyces coffeae]MBL1097787.1 HAMP domain-containing protein [Streptomyces coffeae]